MPRSPFYRIMFPGEKYEHIVRLYVKYRKLLADILKEGVEDGSFREDVNPNILALNLIGVNEGNLLQWNMNKEEINSRKFTRSFMKLLLNGIRKY